MLNLDFTYGCDPELFIRDPDGSLVSAHLFIPGTKYEPFRVKGGAVQVDGISAEFNIDPVKTEDEFLQNIQQVLEALRDMIPKGHTLNAEPSVGMEPKFFNALPNQVKELGCDPDYQGSGSAPREVWKRYVDAYHRPWACGAGHVHVGWTNGKDKDDMPHMRDCEAMVYLLDSLMYTYFTQREIGTIRSKYYGQRRVFRPKSYGVEFRTPSNAWVQTQEGRKLMFALTKIGTDLVKDWNYEDYSQFKSFAPLSQDLRYSKGRFKSLATQIRTLYERHSKKAGHISKAVEI